MKISRHDPIKRDTSFTVAVLLCSERETACVKPEAILRRERNDDVTTRISLKRDVYLGRLVPWRWRSDRKLWASLVDNLLPLTALLLKGQSDCKIPAAKIWPPCTISCERLYQALFERATHVREYESDDKIRPDRRLRKYKCFGRGCLVTSDGATFAEVSAGWVTPAVGTRITSIQSFS